MSRESLYTADVVWESAHRGRVVMGNGSALTFSAPPDAHGEAGVLTPEDAFVAAVNTCIMLMFLWSAERLRLKLLSYECAGEGVKRVEIDRTETFTRVTLRPRVRLAAGDETTAAVQARTRRAFQSAKKYSLIANSVKSEVVIEPEIVVEA
jgi:organic hydroperoxide reductase OsmC/OhrA